MAFGFAGGCGGPGRPVQAPVAANPFAPVSAAVPQVQGHAGGPHGAGPTGPNLGKGSELSRVYCMPDTEGHDLGGVNCMAMVDDKVYTGGKDGCLFVWQGRPGAGGDFQLVQDNQPIVMPSSICSLCYDPSSKWLFCGLWDGNIQAYCKDPPAEERLMGHRRSVSSIIVHSGVVVSGSNDGTIRLWTRNQQARRFQMHGQAMNNPSGPVNAVRILGDGLWAGGMTGITCFDLNTLQPRGTIPSQHPVASLLELDGHMLATYRNGDVKIFDAAGNEKYLHPSRGEHTSNQGACIMTHPLDGKPMLLCGQQLGYVTAYDLPDFRPRGSWACKHNSDVRAILDVKAGGLFLTAGGHSDVMVWKWGAGGATAHHAPGPGGVGAFRAASPFAPAGGMGMGMAPQAASPFGAPAAGYGVAGDGMMG